MLNLFASILQGVFSLVERFAPYFFAYKAGSTKAELSAKAEENYRLSEIVKTQGKALDEPSHVYDGSSDAHKRLLGRLRRKATD